MTTSLSGNWRFCVKDDPDFARLDYNDRTWSSMFIPQNWFLDGLDHHGVVWFRHTFEYKAEGPFTTLHFDGVDYFTDVYLNGTHLGSHSGYFDPFTFDVTNALLLGKNILAVRVDSPYEQPGLDGWYLHKRLVKGVLNHHDCRPGGGWDLTGQSFNTGGIWNRVTLEAHGPVTIERLLLRANLDIQPPILHAELTINNRSREQKAMLEIRCDPENFKGKTSAAKFMFDLPTGESVQKAEMSIEEVQLWLPWDRGFPHLYQVTAALTATKNTSSRSTLFGIRSVRMDEKYNWFLNGEPYFLRGSNYIASQWLSETLFEEVEYGQNHPFGQRKKSEKQTGGNQKALTWFERDVALAKQANLNILRVHAHILPAEFHTACDRAGILVWQDFPLIWGYSDEPAFHAEAERQMREMVLMLYNHPSIVAWCCHNESPADSPWMAGTAGAIHDPGHNRALDTRLQQIARELDPTRYAHQNSGHGDGHTYPGWYVGHWRDYQNLPEAPFITEYGAQALPVKENILRMLPQFPDDAGYSELLRLKTWIESVKKAKSSLKFMMKFGAALWTFLEKTPALKKLSEKFQLWVMKRGAKIERSIYQNLPSEAATPAKLHPARKVWEAWRFHDFQPMETFENGIQIGQSLDEFIANSQAYQSHLLHYATECYRRAKYEKVNGIFQFDFTDPWPAVTWSVLDYWRLPKSGFEALQRAMQPVLPSFILPEKIEANKAVAASFRAVNDFTKAFPGATCTWRLTSQGGDAASASFPVDIPSDGVSAETRLTLPSLRPGTYTLSATLTSSGIHLGENRYEIIVA